MLQALSKLFHPHGDLSKIAPETFQQVWEKLDDAKEAADAEVTMKVRTASAQRPLPGARCRDAEVA
eukprot:COSAG06_NODE_2979_length_5993_cov_127.879539_1_plen_66_part_00